MILYASDWAKYPTATINLETTNTSWIRICSIYKQFGVHNHCFPLAIVDKSLVGINPFAPLGAGGLTIEQVQRITIECKINPWFFFREIARAPGMAGSAARKLEANRGNIALYWLFFNHIFTILIQIRQTGKSFSTDTLMNYLMNVGTRDTKINLLTKNDDLRRKNIQRLKEIYAELPAYFQQKTRADSNNNEEITVMALGNYYNTHVPQSSEKAAINMGRGLTSPIFHIDEPPFQPHIGTAMKAALPALGAAADIAKEAGSPYGVILTTTAGKRDDRDGKYVYNLVEEAAVWTEALFDCKDPQELDKTIRNMSRNRVKRVNITLNHRQLGKTDEWLLEKLEEAVQEGDDANRDYFNMWTAGGLTSPIPENIVERMSKSCREPDWVEIHQQNRYTTRWYVPRDSMHDRLVDKTTILSIDSSEAIGKDDISLVWTDPETFATLGAGHYNETNIIIFAKWLADLFVRFPKMVAIIERKSTGSSLLDYLLVYLPERGIDPFKRLFNTVVQRSAENKQLLEEIKNTPMYRRDQHFYAKYKQTFGFNTAGSGAMARSVLYTDLLLQTATKSCDVIFDKKMIDQIVTLEVRNNRIDHSKGGHDDMVISWLLAHYLMSKGNNLAFYGLDVMRIGMYVRDGSDETRPETMLSEAQIHEQNCIKDKMAAIVAKLDEATDSVVIMRLEQELRAVSRHLIADSNEAYNIEAVIAASRDKRRSERKAKPAVRMTSDPRDPNNIWGQGNYIPARGGISGFNNYRW